MMRNNQSDQEISIGFYEGFYETLSEVILTKVFQESQEGQFSQTSLEKTKTVILAKSVLLMKHHEFRQLSPYLFTYTISSDQRPLAKSIDDSTETFDGVKRWAKKILEESVHG